MSLVSRLRLLSRRETSGTTRHTTRPWERYDVIFIIIKSLQAVLYIDILECAIVVQVITEHVYHLLETEAALQRVVVPVSSKFGQISRHPLPAVMVTVHTT